MERDFIAELIYHIFSKEKKENPMPETEKTKLFDKIFTTIAGWKTSGQKQTDGE